MFELLKTAGNHEKEKEVSWAEVCQGCSEHTEGLRSLERGVVGPHMHRVLRPLPWNVSSASPTPRNTVPPRRLHFTCLLPAAASGINGFLSCWKHLQTRAQGPTVGVQAGIHIRSPPCLFQASQEVFQYVQSSFEFSFNSHSRWDI